jgi:4-amino-4-deoxy-L-arabinose transferase-like glycosyltransferase
LLPWTPLTIVWLTPVLRLLTRRGDIGTLDLRLLLWAVVPLIFYTVSVGKQPRYVLPVLPPIALLLAGSIIERTREWRSLDGARVRPRPNRAVVFGCALSGLFLMSLAYSIFRIQALFVDVGDALTLTAVAVIGVAGFLVVVISFTSAWRAAPAALAFGAALTFAVLPWGVLSAPRDSAVAQLAERLKEANGAGHRVGTYGVLVRNLVFYSGHKQADLINDDHLASFIAENPNALVVLPLADLTRVERERGLRLQPLAQIRYFDEGQIKVRTLLQPNVDQDLQTVVLARVP